MVLTKDCNAIIQRNLPKKLKRPLTLPSDTVPTPSVECKAIIMDAEFVPKEEVQVAKWSEERETPEKAEVTLSHASSMTPIQELEAPHPQKPRKETKDEHCSQFLEAFKKLQSNISFAKVLKKGPLFTRRNFIDAERGKLVLRLRKDWMVFKVLKPPRPPNKGGTCM